MWDQSPCDVYHGASVLVEQQYSDKMEDHIEDPAPSLRLASRD